MYIKHLYAKPKCWNWASIASNCRARSHSKTHCMVLVNDGQAPYLVYSVGHSYVQTSAMFMCSVLKHIFQNLCTAWKHLPSSAEPPVFIIAAPFIIEREPRYRSCFFHCMRKVTIISFFTTITNKLPNNNHSVCRFYWYKHNQCLDVCFVTLVKMSFSFTPCTLKIVCSCSAAKQTQGIQQQRCGQIYLSVNKQRLCIDTLLNSKLSSVLKHEQFQHRPEMTIVL